jgi:hypothetical protein
VEIMPASTMPVAMRAALAIALTACAASQVLAQTLTEREARSAVAAPRGVSVAIADLDFLTPQLRSALEAVASQLPYYAAIAVSPGEPASSQLNPGVVNFHSPEAARQRALATCNAQRTSGGPCVIVAEVRPRRYEPGAPTLSVNATEALRGAYRRLDAPKAFAISPSTGAFGYARGDGGRALATCAARASDAGASDCRIFVSDR